MVNWIKARNYGKVFLDRKADLDTLVDKGRVDLSDETGETAPALTFRYWRNQRRVNSDDSGDSRDSRNSGRGFVDNTMSTTAPSV